MRGFRPVDAGFFLHDFLRVGRAVRRLRLFDDRAALQRRQRAHHQIGAESRKFVMQVRR